MKIKDTVNQSVISLIINKRPTNKHISIILKYIKKRSPTKPILQIFVQTNNKYYTLLPPTKINQEEKGIKPLIKKLVEDKLLHYEKQYDFLSNIITIHCKLTK